jgi:hypothetical protein
MNRSTDMPRSVSSAADHSAATAALSVVSWAVYHHRLRHRRMR